MTIVLEPTVVETEPLTPDCAIATLLRATAARLIEKGWRQGALGLWSGPNCLLGALSHTSRDLHGTVKEQALRTLRGNIPKFGGNIPKFNDAPGRTRDQVVALLLDTAAALDPSGVVTVVPEPVLNTSPR